MELNFLQKYLVPLYQAPDTPADPEPIDPAIAAADPPADVGDVDPPDTDPVDPPPADPDPQHGNKGKSPWFMDRISDLSHKARQAEEKAASAERKAREAEELLARIQQGDKTAPAPIPRQPSGDPDIDARVAERVYQQNVNQIIQRGRNAVGRDQFDKSAGVLVAVAGDQLAHEIVNAVYNVDPDRAHLIVHQLGNDPDRVADLIAMNPVQKVAEITRIAMTAAAPKTEPKTEPKAPPAKVVSKAPAPAPQVDPVATKTINFKSGDSDKMSDEEWSKQWDSEYTTPRASRRR